MRPITSPSAFKTCYIAEVKEELGILKKRKKHRKIKAPQHMKEIIKEAINKLGTSATYRQIQEKCLEIYKQRFQKNKIEKLQKFRENFKADKTLVIKIAQDEEIPYAD